MRRWALMFAAIYALAGLGCAGMAIYVFVDSIPHWGGQWPFGFWAASPHMAQFAMIAAYSFYLCVDVLGDYKP